MTALPDGSAICDRCGRGCGNGSVVHAVVAFAQSTNGEPVALHWCLSAEPPNERCAAVVLDGALPARPGGPVELWQPPPPPDPAT